MYWDYSKIYNQFSDSEYSNLLSKGRWGLEKESVRITGTGDLALTPHPEIFGDKIENPYITTDFSESQIELVTPAFYSIEKSFDFLSKLQEWVQMAIGEEMLWPLSMPGLLPHDDRIPVARYNNSKKGMEKEIYRTGLALRYGKKMQMISGIHYNFSFHNGLLEILHEKFAGNENRQTFKNETYMAMTRNFLRYRWLLFYLFGASPLADDSYRKNIEQKFKDYEKFCIDSDDLFCYLENATSLRMSRFGYENSMQKNFPVSYDSLADHIRDLRRVLSTKSDLYSDMGIFKDGQQLQLNDRFLQIENEYYSPVRLKQTIPGEGSHLDALEQKGIDYLEIRTFDLNPYEKTGIAMEEMYFIHVFLIYCLFEESSPLRDRETELINSNAQKAALFGRQNNLELIDLNYKTTTLKGWGSKIFNKLIDIAELLDITQGHNKYKQCVENQYKKIKNISLLPSSKIVEEINKKNESFRTFGLKKAMEYSGQIDSEVRPKIPISTGKIPGNPELLQLDKPGKNTIQQFDRGLK